MTRRLPLGLAAAATLFAAALPAAAQAPVGEAQFHATTLNLSAYGEVQRTPDQATISLGVTTEAPTAVEAMQANSQRMSATVATLKAQGIADRDIQTSGLSLQAQYAYEQNRPPRLTGYNAANQVTVVVRDLGRLGGVIDRLVQAGANQISGISFGLANPKAAEDEARREAVKALADKAGLYAQATGYHVGRLVSLSESGGYAVPPPRPLVMMRMAAAAAPAPPPIETGELKVRVEVNATYELGR